MKCEMPSLSISKDAQILGLAISRAIRCSADEKDALRRICTLLGYWEVKVSPDELGKDMDCVDKLDSMYQEEWH